MSFGNSGGETKAFETKAFETKAPVDRLKVILYFSSNLLYFSHFLL